MMRLIFSPIASAAPPRRDRAQGRGSTRSRVGSARSRGAREIETTRARGHPRPARGAGLVSWDDASPSWKVLRKDEQGPAVKRRMAHLCVAFLAQSDAETTVMRHGFGPKRRSIRRGREKACWRSHLCVAHPCTEVTHDVDSPRKERGQPSNGWCSSSLLAALGQPRL